jgi:hypothetical protein
MSAGRRLGQSRPAGVTATVTWVPVGLRRALPTHGVVKIAVDGDDVVGLEELPYRFRWRITVR